IRDGHVTGVQTCALPISLHVSLNVVEAPPAVERDEDEEEVGEDENVERSSRDRGACEREDAAGLGEELLGRGQERDLEEEEADRSEERRVGKEGGTGRER